MRLILGFFCCLVCCGCAQGVFGRVDSFSFLKVELVQADKKATLVNAKRQGQDSSPSSGMLKVTVKTATNLWNLSRGSSLNLWYKIRTCGPASIELSGTGAICWHDIAINQGAMSAQQLASGISADSVGDNEQAAFEYSVLVKPDAEYRDLGEFEQFAYDLRENPVDLCLQMGGGAMFPVGFRSDEIVIPKAAVMKALSRTAF